MVSQLKCYSSTSGVEMKRCQEERGFTSCFTKYDAAGQVTGRGCSDKGQQDLFEDDYCETFQSKEKVILPIFPLAKMFQVIPMSRWSPTATAPTTSVTIQLKARTATHRLPPKLFGLLCAWCIC